MSSDNGHTAAIVAAFFLGAVAGAATALLWAPQAGEETRRLLAEKAREGRERAAEAALRGREMFDRQREQVTEAIERGREAYQRARGTEQEQPA